MSRRTAVNFGSAQLLVGRMDESTARALLQAAVEAGVERLDTAPLYGHGGSEALVAEVAAMSPGVRVTTKVGLEPSAPPPPWRASLGLLAARLPPSIRGSLRALLRRPPNVSQAIGRSGRFGLGTVAHSIERSLARLGPIDRLLLHEVHPADIDEGLLDLLDGYRRRGDIAALGVATGNGVTTESLRRSHGLFTIAHVSVDPLGEPLVDAAALATSVQLVGHGALGAGGRTLAVLQRHIGGDRALSARWSSAVARSAFAGPDGIACALLARAAAGRAGELLVATRQRRRVGAIVRAASGTDRLPAAAMTILDDALAAIGTPASTHPGATVRP